ncbi:hypothetical protein ACFX13_042701 [Malus domestica]
MCMGGFFLQILRSKLMGLRYYTRRFQPLKRKLFKHWIYC